MVLPERGKHTLHLQNGETAQEGSQLPDFRQLDVIQNYWLHASFWVFRSQVRYVDGRVGVWCMFQSRTSFPSFFFLFSF